MRVTPRPGCLRGLKPLPEPVLQRVEADEPGIRGQQRVLVPAALGALPGEFHRIDEHEARGCLGTGVSIVIGSAAKLATSASVAECSVTVAGESSSVGVVVTNAK